MNIDLWSILAHIVNLGIIYIIVRLLIYKPVVRFLNARRDKIAQEQEQLVHDRQEMDQVLKNRDNILEEAKRETLALAQSNEQRMEKQAQQIVAAAQGEAAELLRRARQQMQAQQDMLNQQMRAQVVELSMDVAQRVLLREVKLEDHQRMVDDFLKEGVV